MLFFKKLFKPEKSEIEVRREKYMASLSTVTETYNGIRINETLRGRLSGKTMDEVEFDATIVNDTPKYPTQTSVPRPKIKNEKGEEVSFGNNFFGWINIVREEAKTAMNQNYENEKQEKEKREKIRAEKNEKALKERREFYVNYGLLPSK